jgi:hypothetical protein
MYLVANVSGFYFGVPLRLVAKVLEINQIDRKDDGVFYGGNKVILLDGHDFLGINGDNRLKKNSALLIDKDQEKGVALLIDEVVGFMDEKDAGLFKKMEFMNLYGFKWVSSFSFLKGKIVYGLDEKIVQAIKESVMIPVERAS